MNENDNRNDDYFLPWFLVTMLTILTLIVWAIK